MQDYKDAGVVGVSSANLSKVNKAVKDTTGTHVDTVAEIQALVNKIISIDTTKPVITLKGASSLELTKGTAYTELGATATDDRDGTVTVTTSGSVDVNTVGTYTITYKAKDSAGNEAVATRTIKIVLPPKNNLKVTLKTTEKIAGYEVHLKFTNDTPIQSTVVMDNSFLGTTGRTVKNLGADINTTTKEIKFGGFTYGNQEGVTGDFDVMTLKSADSQSQITITEKSCTDKDANDIACDVTISVQ